jgi:hypothetical protein
MAVGLDDDFNGVPAPWDLYVANSSTAGPEGNVWGDYSRVRTFRPSGTAWVASGHTEQPGLGNAQPRFVIFGRERDRDSVERWWDK